MPHLTGEGSRSPARRPIDAVIFDWGGTLTPWHDVDSLAIWREYAHAYCSSPHAGGRAAGDGVGAADADQVARRLHLAEEAAWRAGRTENVAATLALIVRAAGLDPDAERHLPALSAYERAWEPHTWTDPDAVPLLAGLRQRGLRVGVLSNTVWTREYHERVFARDGVLEHLDGAVYSSEIAHVKPHPAAFAAALTAVGVDDPRRAVFVGDRLFDDVYGAARVGMRTVLVPHSTIPEHQRGHTEGEPDAVVKRLSDVLSVVDRWLAGPDDDGPDRSAGPLGQAGEVGRPA